MERLGASIDFAGEMIRLLRDSLQWTVRHGSLIGGGYRVEAWKLGHTVEFEAATAGEAAAAALGEAARIEFRHLRTAA